LPKKIEPDADGNAMAVFNLGPKKKLEIELIGSAKVSTPQIDPDYGGSFSALPKNLISKYTAEKKYWSTHSKKIIEVAGSLKDSNNNVVKNAELVYKYITANMTYDFDGRGLK
jgi:hypothetical protein